MIHKPFIACLHLCLCLKRKIPCHNSIRNWLCKCGISRVRKTSLQNDKYVIYVDKSISFGSEKILLILGVNTNKIPKNRSSCHADMEVHIFANDLKRLKFQRLTIKASSGMKQIV